MATTHVFIVNENTFKIHLQYMFAGTGRKDDRINQEFDIQEKGSRNCIEKNNFSLATDVSRCKKGDKILFYVTGIGKFYGVFKVKNEFFLDKNDDDTSKKLSSELGIRLPFRITIEPDVVYPEGIEESKALDSIKDIKHPYQMQWSLIYRKLQGRRGCSMITPYESKKLISMIAKKNSNKSLQTSTSFAFKKIIKDEKDESKIEIFDNKKTIEANQNSIDYLEKIITKIKSGHAYELYIQGYILQNIGKGKNLSLDKALVENNKINYLGNEVICSVGKQAMDILLELESSINNKIMLVPIELKKDKAEPYIVDQISKYITWLEEYYISNLSDTKGIEIDAIILTAKESEIDENNEYCRKSYSNFKKKLKEKNKGYSDASILIKIKHIVFSIKKGEIIFEEVK